MFHHSSQPCQFERDCAVVMIPSGDELTLPAGTIGYITQSLGGSFTVFVDGNLFRTRQAKLVGFNVFGDGRTGANSSVTRNSNRSNQLSIGTDKHAVLDDRLELVGTVIITGDGASADVNAGANLAITEISEMAGLAALSQAGVFDFNKVADTAAFCQFGSGAKTGKGPDLTRAMCNNTFQNAVRVYFCPGGQATIFQNTTRTDTHIITQADLAFKNSIDINKNICANIYNNYNYNAK